MERRVVRVMRDYTYAQVSAKDEETGSECWVFEHRYVARQFLGRPLPKGWGIKWRNGDTLDNRPENLILGGVPLVEWRDRPFPETRPSAGIVVPNKPHKTRTKPKPETKPCACGCGKMANPGCKVIKGHGRKMQSSLLVVLDVEPMTIEQLARATGKTMDGVRTTLTKLVRRGQTERVAKGLYRLPASP
jgi:hypothetical protein